MSKTRARKPASYATEARLFAQAARIVESNGFRNVVTRKTGSVKIIDAETESGGRVSFWVKLGWSEVPYAAIQFGMFTGPRGSSKSDAEFVELVKERCERMKDRGVTHALLVHQGTFAIALRIADVIWAYAEQMRLFPASARNTKSPTMWFFDPRTNREKKLTEIPRRRAIPLDILAGRVNVKPDEPQVRKRMAEIEVRLMQQAFRSRVGKHCGWRCAVTGSTIRETLDAAHLPGRAWRLHNEGTDGLLLRADIHRLIDSGLAWIRDGRFFVSDAAKSDYAAYDGQRLP